MRLIDADDLLAKVQENAPGFMDSGSTITKAFIMAMINTKSVAPTIDAVPVIRCKHCKFRQNRVSRIIDGKECNLCEMVKGYKSADWFCADRERKE